MRARNLLKLSILFISSVATIATLHGAIASAQTQVNAIVCGLEVQPMVTIESPLSDSTITSQSFILSGNSARANQVIISVDSVYDQTKALAAGQTSYQATLALPNGTHEIAAQATSGACSATARVVINVAIDGDSTPPETTQPTEETQTPPPSSSTKATIYEDPFFESQQSIPTYLLGDGSNGGVTLINGAKEGVVTPFDVIMAIASSRVASKVVEVFWMTVFASSIGVAIASQAAVHINTLKYVRPHRGLFLVVSLIIMVLSLVLSA